MYSPERTSQSIPPSLTIHYQSQLCFPQYIAHQNLHNRITPPATRYKRQHYAGAWRQAPCRQAVHQPSGKLPESPHLRSHNFSLFLIPD